jgi:hypothetical protein
MILDAFTALSGSITGNTVTAQATFASGASVLSTNTMDLSTGGGPGGNIRDIGEGNDLARGRVTVVAAFTGGTSAEFQVIQADDAALTTNVTVIGTTGAVPVASLTAGARFDIELNARIGSRGQRYLGGRTVNVGANTTGSIYMDIGADIQDGQKFYTNGFAVL